LARVVVLVRHATVVETSDSQLDDSGLMMANAVAKELAKISPNHIFSSPAPRARLTADIIAGNLRLSVKEDPRLVERRAERLKENDFRVRWLEGFDSVMSRLTSFFGDAPAGVSLAITHKESIRAAISAVLGMDDVTGSGTRVANCSLTTIVITNGSTRLLSIGSPALTQGLVKRIGEAE
jgi:broad specificity phosphatase PhoE